MQNETDARLHALHHDYTEAVNLAVAEGRDDIVDGLIAEYPDAALRLLRSEHPMHAA